MFYSGGYDNMFKKVEGKIKPSPKKLNFFLRIKGKLQKADLYFVIPLRETFPWLPYLQDYRWTPYHVIRSTSDLTPIYFFSPTAPISSAFCALVKSNHLQFTKHSAFFHVALHSCLMFLDIGMVSCYPFAHLEICTYPQITISNKTFPEKFTRKP